MVFYNISEQYTYYLSLTISYEFGAQIVECCLKYPSRP